jgi:gliding motility-associated-like protein
MNKISLLLAFSVFFTINVKSQGDDCVNASLITPNLTSCVYTSGLSAGATQSLPGCSGNADDDVWFYFVANSTEMTVKVAPTVGYDAVFQLYSGSCAGSSLGCRDMNPVGIDEKYTYTGLTIGASYYLRVYHYAAGYGTATFKVCVSGLAPTTNVNPCSAYLLPNLSPACDFLTYSISNHGGSGISTPSSCGGSSPYQGGYSGGDMWFKLVVPSSGNVEISTLPVGISDAAMALYRPATSSCGSSLTQIACNDDRDPGNNKWMPYIYSTGNTPGDTLYARIWDYSNNSSGKFKICASTPDNDDCPTALQICDLNGYSGSTSPQYTPDRPGNMAGKDELPSGPFGIGYTGASPVQIDNNSWMTFVASATSASFTVDIEDCLFSGPAGGLQMQIFSGTNCNSFAPVSNFLETKTSQVLNATSLVVGNTYYIMADGYAGDVCSYTITANSGVQVVEVVSTDTNVCIGNSATLTAKVFGTGSYSYSWYSIPAGGPYPSSSTIVDIPSVTTEYFVNVTGLCGEVTQSSFKVFVSPSPVAPSVSTSANPICPSGSSIITASGTPGATYSVYTASSGGTLLGTTPYTYNPVNNFTGTVNFYVEATTSAGCISSSRTQVSITSQDNVGPSVSCPANQVVYVNTGCTYTLTNFTGMVTASDNCYSAVTNITQSPAAGTVLSGHNTNQIVTITATDSAGNASTCFFIVNLQDAINPQVNCPGNVTAQVDGSCQYSIPDYRSFASSSDNCTASNNIIFTQVPAPGTIIGGVGTVQTISIIGSDGANNKDTCMFTLTLYDQTPATITCPADQNDTVITEGCSYSVPDFTSISNLASDNCSNGGGSANISQVPAPNTVIDLSQNDVSFLVTLTYTDASNNQSSCSFNVNAVCLREVEIPQFYTPNGDGTNDFFEIRNLVIYPNNTLKIFNRWGDLVYEKENYDNSWGGESNSNSNELPSGTYFYVFDIKDKESKTGFVHLKK